MTKIVYNATFGGFNLSDEGAYRYAELKNISLYKDGIFGQFFSGGNFFTLIDVARTDPILIQVIEELGEKANTPLSKLKIIDLPSGTKYIINEYDGLETVMTIDDFDWKIA
jgi:hypothetical protein